MLKGTISNGWSRIKYVAFLDPSSARRRPDALYRDGSRGDDRLEVTESVPGYVSFRLVG
jgi:hypothetical protein